MRALCLAVPAAQVAIAQVLATAGRRAGAMASVPLLLSSGDATGELRTLNVNGPIDVGNPFFQDLGTNRRRCVTCHQPADAWTIRPQSVQQRFILSHGADPIFTNNDGSNCEGAVARTPREQRAAFSLLLSRGLIRVGLDIPPGAEFALDGVTDPNQCGRASNDFSLYRRPLPTTNLPFLTAVMWDGRESPPATTLTANLAHQANGATRGHAQAAADLTDDQARQIVQFEMALFTAQAPDERAGRLNADGATGGPFALSRQPFFIGINDPVGLNPTGAQFDTNVFTLFDAWTALETTAIQKRFNAGPSRAARCCSTQRRSCSKASRA